MKKRGYIFQMTVAFLFLSTLSANASELSTHGFLQGNCSANTDASNPDGDDFKWMEVRSQIKIDGSKDPFHFFLKADGSYDVLDERTAVELREGYLDFTADKLELRIGRQMITWGLGDLIFINDVFPKDYAAFFSGRPMEYLKKGVDGVGIRMYPEVASFELVAIPFFKPNNFPKPERFYMFDPMPAITNRQEEKPAATLKNTEMALRVYQSIADFDVAVYFYQGFWRQPAIKPDNPTSPTRLTMFYPKLNVTGISLQGRMLDGVLSLEAGEYTSTEDRNGTDPMIPNSQTKFLIGYQRQILEDFTIGLQYYGEYMNDYSEYEKNLPSGFSKENKLHDFLTIRATQFLMHQNLRLGFFAIYSPSDKDYLLNPEIKYNISDSVWAAVGGNVFGGAQDWSQFGQLKKNDNVYIQTRYEF